MCSMQAPRVQYEVWIGGLFNVFQRPLVKHPMTAAETMQSQYTFSGDLDGFGAVMHTAHHVGWPFRIHYMSETGSIHLEILRPTKYTMHDAGAERGDIIEDLESNTIIRTGRLLDYTWGRTVSFQWDDVTSPSGIDDVTVMIKRPQGFESLRTDHPVQSELRELLSQLHLASRVDAIR